MNQNSRPTTSRRTSAIRKRRARKRRTRIMLLLMAVLTLFIIAEIFLIGFTRNHFSNGTTINQVDCSNLTAEDATEKLNTELKTRPISFIFTDISYTFTGADFDLHVSSDEVEELLANQIFSDNQKDFIITVFFDKNKVLDIMKSIPELDESKMIYPHDAFLTVEDNQLYTIPEVRGNHIDSDEAIKLAYESLLYGTTSIDFSSITVSEPMVHYDDLQETTNSINNVLNTTITFEIGNGSHLTLDKSVMCNWLVVNDDGTYKIDIDSNLPAFVDQLSEMVSNSTIDFEFQATDFGTVTVPVKNITIDKEAEIELIKSELGTANNYTHSPIYNLNVGDSYVEIDITRQHVWLYKNGECLASTDCVTGNAGKHDTPLGYFFLTYKTTDRTLRGYNDNGTQYASHVDFWMPFNGGIGLHDASWRNSFGGKIYLTNGSHGCVNLPKEAARTIYEYIDDTMPIIVYSS